MNRPTRKAWSAQVALAVSRASLAVGRFEGVLGSLPQAVGRHLRLIAGENAGVANPADAEALRVVLAVAGDSAALTDLLLDSGDDEAVVARCENLVGVAVRTERALRTIGVRLDADRRRVEASAAGRYGAAVLELLIERDRLSVRDGAEQLSASPTTIGAVLERLVQLGVAEEITGKRRGRWFRYAALREAMSDVLQPETAVAVHNGAVCNEDGAMAARPVREWVPVVVERVFQGSDAQRVVLFGSVARGDERADSDIDLLVVLPHVTRAHDDAVNIMRLLRDIPCGVDVIVTDDDRLVRQSKVPGVIRVALREGRTFERAA